MAKLIECVKQFFKIHFKNIIFLLVFYCSEVGENVVKNEARRQSSLLLKNQGLNGSGMAIICEKFALKSKKKMFSIKGRRF